MTVTTPNFAQLSAKLDQNDLRAIEMKYEGYTYKQIAEETGWTHQYVRLLFYKGGRLTEYYAIYASEENEIRRTEARTMFKAHVPNAVRTLVQIMNKSKFDTARVQAAKEVINREMGEPVKVILNVDEVKVNEYLEAAVKLDNNENIPTDEPRGESADVA